MLDKPQHRDTQGLVNSQVLQIFNNDPSFILVVLGSPMIIQIIQYLNPAIDIIKGLAENTGTSECLDGIHEP